MTTKKVTEETSVVKEETDHPLEEEGAGGQVERQVEEHAVRHETEEPGAGQDDHREGE